MNHEPRSTTGAALVLPRWTVLAWAEKFADYLKGGAYIRPPFFH